MQGCRCMKRFKHLSAGMSFLEVIAAIALLAIFGSSLFLSQAYIFEKLSFAQKKMIASLRMRHELQLLQNKIFQEWVETLGNVSKSLQKDTKDFQSPDMQTTVTVRTDFQETIFKDFKDLYCVSIQAKQDDRSYGNMYMLMHIPKIGKS